MKQIANDHIDQLAPLLRSLKDSIAIWAEPSLEEVKTAGLLKATLAAADFNIEENLGEIHTLFSASYGHTGPTIAILGEYDADIFESGQTGHASGHHWLGVGGVGAALSLKQLIASGKLEAQLVYVGSTAEGGFGGRAHLARKQYFKGVDLAIFWHPSPITWASSRPWDALIDLEIKFIQEQVKAIELPHDSYSLLTQVLKFTDSLEKLKVAMDSTIHLHYSLASSKASYTFTQDSILVKIRIEAVQQARANKVYHSIVQMVTDIQQDGLTADLSIFRAIHAFLPNNAGMQMVAKNMEKLGPIPFSEDEQRQAKEIQRNFGVAAVGLSATLLPFQPHEGISPLRKYASDIGDVSWWTPTLSFVATCYPRGIPMRRAIAANLAYHPFGERGMLYAAKLICSSVVNYLTDEKLQQKIKEEFQRRISSESYKVFAPIIPPTAENNKKRTK